MKKVLLVFSIVFTLVGILTSCNAQSPGGSDLKPNDFKARVDQTNVQLLDVRTPEEYSAGHIKGSVNLDWYDAAFKTKAATLDKSKPVYVYCAVGGRSAQAKNLLQSLGFTSVFNLSGGIEAWKKMNLPIEK